MARIQVLGILYLIQNIGDVCAAYIGRNAGREAGTLSAQRSGLDMIGYQHARQFRLVHPQQTDFVQPQGVCPTAMRNVRALRHLSVT